MSGTSFYWAMRLLPRARRQAMFALYGYCRAIDDVADGDASVEEKRRRLAGFRADIGRLFEGAAAPVERSVAALADPVAAFALPRAELEALVDGMEMDVNGPLTAPGRDQLSLYCRRVAGAVGLLAVRIFQRSDAHAFALLLGEALQLTNILRDIAEDAALGRLYLPAELLDEAGIPARDPAGVLTHPALPRARALLAAEAEQRFHAAEAELARIGRRGLWPAVAMMATYRLLLRRMAGRGWSHGGPPPRVSAAEKLWIALRHAAGP